jgi:hypothetical protein
VKLAVHGEDATQLAETVTDASGLAKVARNSDVRHIQATLGRDSYAAAFDDTLSQVSMWHFAVRHSWMN